MKHDIKRIFRLLSEESFKDPDTGLLFFPAYIYTYSPEDEYQIRKEIESLREDLKRPSNNLHCLVINIYDKFIDHLKSSTLSGETLFDTIIELEQSEPAEAEEFLKEKAQSSEFLEALGTKFRDYFDRESDDKIYLLVHGFGSIFPYLRASHFLKNMEKYVKHYKLILFYPGTFKHENYSLFDVFNDDNLYRATHLNQILQ